MEEDNSGAKIGHTKARGEQGSKKSEKFKAQDRRRPDHRLPAGSPPKTRGGDSQLSAMQQAIAMPSSGRHLGDGHHRFPICGL